jgi:uncharacterized protein YbcV (DUF1398 family)
MNVEHALSIYDTVRGSLTAELSFAEIVGRLSEIGVERYHADYSRGETTYYLASGESLVVEIPWEKNSIATEFSAEAIAEAVQKSQRGEHTYSDFVRKSMASGCVGYFVQIAGRRVLYFGRGGEIHTEWFPGAN